MSKGPMITQDARHYREDMKYLARKKQRLVIMGYTGMVLICGILYYALWAMIHP